MAVSNRILTWTCPATNVEEFEEFVGWRFTWNILEHQQSQCVCTKVGDFSDFDFTISSMPV